MIESIMVKIQTQKNQSITKKGDKMDIKVFDLPEHLVTSNPKVKIVNDNSGWGWRLLLGNKGSLSLPTLKSPEGIKQVIDAIARQVGRKNIVNFLGNIGSI